VGKKFVLKHLPSLPGLSEKGVSDKFPKMLNPKQIEEIFRGELYTKVH